jgi:hypothetical protein
VRPPRRDCAATLRVGYLVCGDADRTLTIIVVAAAGTGRHTPGTRAKDSDRTDTCQVLDSALADGQLSMEEHRTRVALATEAETLGDLQSLVSDLQTDNAPVQLPDLKKRPRLPGAGGSRGIGIAIAVVLVLLGIAIGWGLYGNTSSPLSFQSDPGAKADGVAPNVSAPPRLLHSVGGLTGLLQQSVKKFGDTMGYSLVIYPDYAVMERADPNDDRRVLRYSYRGGWEGDPSAGGKSDDERMVDLGKFDVNAIVGRLRGAPQILGIEQKDVKTIYLSIDPSKDPTTPGAIGISIYVSTTYDKGGRLEVDPQGNVTSQYPPS